MDPMARNTLEQLMQFQRNWKFHHNIENQQLDFAGRKAKVTEISWYHGGDVLCRLEDGPGIWNERCLELSNVPKDPIDLEEFGPEMP